MCDLTRSLFAEREPERERMGKKEEFPHLPDRNVGRGFLRGKLLLTVKGPGIGTGRLLLPIESGLGMASVL